jgi:hypothetical protein
MEAHSGAMEAHLWVLEAHRAMEAYPSPWGCARKMCPRIMYPQTKSLGSSVPWTMRPLEDAALGYCVLILDCIQVLVKLR